ncbi:MAG: recombinase family protein [Chloroflexi bacterium]|nr:recombinase family protein [Chloroflexota bacterium]
MNYPVAIYARVSTADRDQDPETQLMQLREHCQARGGLRPGRAPSVSTATSASCGMESQKGSNR